MNNKAACLTIMASAMAMSAFAAPTGSFLSPAALAELAATGELRASSTGKTAGMTLQVAHPAVAAIKAALMDEAPDVVVEALFLMKKPAAADRSRELLAVYNAMRSLGSMKGIEYFSASRNKMRLFYEESSLVSGPDGKTPVADSLRAALPAAERLYARQKDLSFGDNLYRIDLSSGADYVLSASTNLTAMRYGIIPVAGAGRLTVRVFIIATDDAFIFYVVSSAKATVVPGIRGKLEDSFGNRAAAVYAWFGRRIADAFSLGKNSSRYRA